MRPSSSWSTTTRERRSVIAPPEMTNGSSSGSVSSSSSARAMRIGHEVEKVQLATPPLQGALILELQEARNEAVGGVEEQLVEGALRARAGQGCGLAQGKLEKGVQLNRGAPAPGVLDHHAAGVDVARAAALRHQPRAQALGLQDTQAAVAQIPAPLRDAETLVEQPVEDDQRVGCARRLQHLELEVVVEAGVPQFHPQPHGGVAADPLRDLPQPPQHLCAVRGEAGARERRREVLFEKQRPLPPRRGPRPCPEAILPPPQTPPGPPP